VNGRRGSAVYWVRVIVHQKKNAKWHINTTCHFWIHNKLEANEILPNIMQAGDLDL